jgi:hypothetical protein
LVAYFDEVGNPVRQASDKDFPVFAVTLLVCDADCYAREIVPAIYKLKFDLFGHEGVILHSKTAMTCSEHPDGLSQSTEADRRKTPQ